MEKGGCLCLNNTSLSKTIKIVFELIHFVSESWSDHGEMSQNTWDKTRLMGDLSAGSSNTDIQNICRAESRVVQRQVLFQKSDPKRGRLDLGNSGEIPPILGTLT